jgi:hypothetical protein
MESQYNLDVPLDSLIAEQGRKKKPEFRNPKFVKNSPKQQNRKRIAPFNKTRNFSFKKRTQTQNIQPRYIEKNDTHNRNFRDRKIQKKPKPNNISKSNWESNTSGSFSTGGWRKKQNPKANSSFKKRIPNQPQWGNNKRPRRESWGIQKPKRPRRNLNPRYDEELEKIKIQIRNSEDRTTRPTAGKRRIDRRDKNDSQTEIMKQLLKAIKEMPKQLQEREPQKKSITFERNVVNRNSHDDTSKRSGEGKTLNSIFGSIRTNDEFV